MLNKKCCKKCRNNYAEEEDYKYDGMEWNESDERRWKNGYVYCPDEIVDDIKEEISRKTKDKPPSKCPYYLENVI